MEICLEAPADCRVSARSATGAVQVAVVVSGWPRVSETFALNELLALHASGMLARVFATKPGEGPLRQPGVGGLDGIVDLLPAADADRQGAFVADRLAGTGVAAVHGYFAHRPAAVAAAAADRLRIPFGFSAHALDVRKLTADELAERAGRAAVVVSCNDDTTAVLQRTGVRVQTVRHGVDVCRFAPRPAPGASVLSVLGVGRLVEKKGFPVLVDALAGLDRPWRLTLVGDGPERDRLVAAIRDRGLERAVSIAGRVTHDQLPEYYAAADVVVVPSVVDGAGDRDGLPNVVLEALASGRPVVASDVAAISSAVRHGVTGLLVPPGEPAAITAALRTLHADRALAARLGAAARAEVEARFDLTRCTAHLCRTLEQSYG